MQHSPALRTHLMQWYQEHSHKGLPPGATSDLRTGYLSNQPVPRLVVTLRTNGCSWARTAGGCLLCGHWTGRVTEPKLLNAQVLLQLFLREVAKYDLTQTPIVSVYCGGSMLNPAEIPTETLLGICRYMAQLPGPHRLVLETRGEYCNRRILSQIRDNLGPCGLDIALGLECADQNFRLVCLNKGLSNQDFAKHTQLIKQFARLRVYIMLKPPFMTEKEALEDAVAATLIAHAAQADEIHVEGATIQQGTWAEQLYLQQLYQLPWLWTIVEYHRRLAGQVRVYTSPFMHEPQPLAIPQNCPSCSDQVRQLLLGPYNHSFDQNLLENLSCSCQARWLKELCRKNPKPYAERLSAALAKLPAPSHV